VGNANGNGWKRTVTTAAVSAIATFALGAVTGIVDLRVSARDVAESRPVIEAAKQHHADQTAHLTEAEAGIVATVPGALEDIRRRLTAIEERQNEILRELR
jgi:demethoxyubiquinone hydroxylase (CLK1/Coq7/Cat5 family)